MLLFCFKVTNIILFKLLLQRYDVIVQPICIVKKVFIWTQKKQEDRFLPAKNGYNPYAFVQRLASNFLNMLYDF